MVGDINWNLAEFQGGGLFTDILLADLDMVAGVIADDCTFCPIDYGPHGIGTLDTDGNKDAPDDISGEFYDCHSGVRRRPVGRCLCSYMQNTSKGSPASSGESSA